jgi:hypothetical protein
MDRALNSFTCIRNQRMLLKILFIPVIAFSDLGISIFYAGINQQNFRGRGIKDFFQNTFAIVS